MTSSGAIYVHGVESSGSRGWAVNLARVLLLCCLFTVMFLPEFAGTGDVESATVPYNKIIDGFRLIDVVLLSLGLLHASAFACSRELRTAFPRKLAVPGLLFVFCIGAGILHGMMRGGTNFFFDWRAIAIGVALFFVWSFWVRTPRELESAVRVFALYMALRLLLLYLQYLAGRGESLLGVAIPVFDGPTLSAIVFTALLALQCQHSAGTPLVRSAWAVLFAAAYLMVLLSFRRTYWGELAVGTVLCLLLLRRRWLGKLMVIALTVCLAAAVMGQAFSGRLLSLAPQQQDSEFSADNADHMDDLADAWEQVRQAPLLGIGVGTSYATWRIRNWKTEAVMVHNAPLHVWLKYGLAGLATYLWFHLALFAWLARLCRQRDAISAPVVNAAFAFLLAQFVMTLGFAPWPYSELQLVTLLSFVMTIAFVAGRWTVPEIPARVPCSQLSQ